MSPRALFKHIRWVFKLLTAEHDHPPRYFAECVVCDIRSEDLPNQFETESWTMRHAAKADAQGRHHVSFRVVQICDAAVTPHPDDLRAVGANWAADTIQ